MIAMIQPPIMAVTKVIKPPHPCTPPRGGDREMLATLDVVYRVPCRRRLIQP